MVAYGSLKTKKKSSWVIPKVVVVAYLSSGLPEPFITKLKSQFKGGFTKVVVTRAVRLGEWLQGELPLYLTNPAAHHRLLAQEESLNWKN